MKKGGAPLGRPPFVPPVRAGTGYMLTAISERDRGGQD